ncbi:MAG TPA: hypothetical protein VGC14_22210 [Rhizobium sp.]
MARSSSIRRLTNISKSDMSITSFIRRDGNVALNELRDKLQFFHDFWLPDAMPRLLAEISMQIFRLTVLSILRTATRFQAALRLRGSR